MGEEGHEAAAAHLLQDPADLRLEQDDEGQNAPLHHTAHDVIHAVELQHGRQHQRRQKYQQSLQQTGGLGALHQHEHLVQDKDHDGDIQKVCRLDQQQVTADHRRQFREFHVH